MNNNFYFVCLLCLPAKLAPGLQSHQFGSVRAHMNYSCTMSTLARVVFLYVLATR